MVMLDCAGDEPFYRGGAGVVGRIGGAADRAGKDVSHGPKSGGIPDVGALVGGGVATVVATLGYFLSLYGMERVLNEQTLYLHLMFAALPIGAMIGLIGLTHDRGFRRFGVLGLMLNVATFIFCFLPWQQWVGVWGGAG